MGKIVSYIKNNPYLILGLLFMAFLVYMMFFRGNIPKITSLSPSGYRQGNITTEQRLHSQIEGLREELDTLKKEFKRERERKVKEQTESKKPRTNTKISEIIRKYTPKIKLRTSQKKQQKMVSKQTKPVTIVKPEPPRLRKISFNLKEKNNLKEKKPKKPETPDEDLFLPAGSFMEATLTFGVFAPSGSKAMPVVGVISRAALGPNKSYIPIRGCNFIGKAKGNIGYRVANIQVTRISCVWPDGTVHESDMNGFLGGTNGMFGVPGRVERFERGFFETEGITSFLAGLTEGVNTAKQKSTTQYSSNITQTATGVTGSPLVYGAYAGIEQMMKAAQSFYAKQNEGFVPAVIVDPGKEVTIAILQGIKIKGGMKNVWKEKSKYYDTFNLLSK